MVAEARDPRDAQLCGRDALALSNLRETFKDFVLRFPRRFSQ
jgi:hypothetical protein